MKYRKARTRKDVENDPRVKEIWNEGEDGWWAYLHPGWIWDGELHCIHEDTIKDVCDALNFAVSPCDCEQSCKTEEVS